MFIDSVKLILSSGHGGAGAVSFRREKHVPLGGPDGGDGGNGGDVIIICDNNNHTLANFQGKKSLSAQNGFAGMGRNKNGKRGENLEISVPQGTQIIDAKSNEILLDLTKHGQREIFLKGGKGGLGNTHFKNSTNQRPDYAQPGLNGESKEVRLELKLIADVGLVGFPNAGKSTLISVLSNARPQIADYEFTTLTPKLGMVVVDDYNSFVMADIPGIIQGASKGKGLGLEFLRHIQRTKFLLFMLDLGRDMSLKEQFLILRKEIENFSNELFQRNFGIAISKCDMQKMTVEFKNKFKEESNELKEFLKNENFSFIIEFSSLEKIGLNELKFKLLNECKK
ncbi:MULTISPECIES: GTPase ObgE [unclassified Campylobacter]|uniref:GTPase ObgE n=1 Tax=unclassified Campylobacter TaxID=2593542 RepID=UPI001237A73E|nr:MULTISPECIES: GTPase ObgE [unclassified Campylobacter]KAA6225107.1 GTPase ObgE [Campylobacter sp. LR196d]KAA6226121.1 GTPase ObgE [Campylobacter sp. LR185c]KAA6228068.1 GTPase ObgE [Campylobacter sp. LR286c]KAA6231321.1 GTPase ObgE [Campylobacter sp. LR264d]KAA6231533.1 GTPase ObgE [Campylobacter sp. LR291e]